MELIDLLKITVKLARIEKVTSNFLLISGFNGQERWKIKRFVPEDMTARIMGLWFGDGDKVRSIGLTNTDINLVIEFLKFTDMLGIPRERFLAEIKVPHGCSVKLKEISKRLKIPLKRIKIGVSERARKPAFRVRLFSRTICRLFHQLVETIAKLGSREAKIQFLRGLIAAEGCIEVRKDGKLHEVMISLRNEKERKWVKENFIHKLGITTNKDSCDSIRIGNKTNLEIIKRLDLVSFHSSKKQKFESSFSRLCSRKTFAIR